MEKTTSSESSEHVVVTLVTPPDIVYSFSDSCLLVHPSASTKSKFQKVINNMKRSTTVYLFESPDTDIQWLLTVLTRCKYVVLDLDNFPQLDRDIISYLIAHPTVYWLTQGDNRVYNTLSRNRIYDLDFIDYHFNGGTFEIPTKL
jgi:hypothetical protein